MSNPDEQKKKISWLEIVRIIVAILSGLLGGAGYSAMM